MRIPVAFICDENFVMQTSVAITSLLKNRGDDTEYTIYVVMAECSKQAEAMLRKTADVHIVRTDLAQFSAIKQLAHISVACLLKFFLCQLIPEEDKLLYLDGDIIVRKDLAELFQTELGDYYAAATPLGLEDGKINAGVMLFNAKKMREDNMAEKLMAFRLKIGNAKSMDQQTFNNMIPDKITRFSWQYNCSPVRIKELSKEISIQQFNQQNHTSYTRWKNVMADAAIIHFASATKPWKHTFVKYADEWYAYYKQSPYGQIPLQRDSKLIFMWKKARRIGVVSYIREKLSKRRNGRKIQDEWDKSV